MAGTVVIHDYNLPNKQTVKCVALGYEYRLSSNDERNLTFSISSGSAEQIDGIFNGKPNLWNTALRELSEEFKNIPIYMGKQRKPDLNMGKTPIWIGHVHKGVSQKSFIPNNEMSDFKYVVLSDIINPLIDPYTGKYIARTIKGNWVMVSQYAVSAVRKAYERKLI